MRHVVALLALAVPTVAAAELPPRGVIWKNQVKRPPPGTLAHAQISKILYLNSCRPNGCTVLPGDDDSRTNRSSIPDQQVRLDAWPYSEAKWQEVVACVRDTFLPFDIEIVTADPGPTKNHFEAMVGGSDNQLDPNLVAGGVAPFLSCGATEDNVISFTFANTTDHVDWLCSTIAQEAAHVWGLDHELHRDDPMTYLDPLTPKRFQNTFADCGEELGSPRECWCGGDQQNSYDYLTKVFNAATFAPPELEIQTPTEGQWVKPGFPIRAAMTTPLTAKSATLTIDGMQMSTVTTGPFVFNAPATLGGKHTITVSGTDSGDRTASATVTVNVTKKCGADTACDSGQACAGGFCIPLDVAGGLGAPCVTDASCITGRCVDGSGDLRCTTTCNVDGSCPDGFQCLPDGAGGLCWPGQPAGGGGGGCTTTTGDPRGAGLGFLTVGGIAALIVGRRRRRTR